MADIDRAVFRDALRQLTTIADDPGAADRADVDWQARALPSRFRLAEIAAASQLAGALAADRLMAGEGRATANSRHCEAALMSYSFLDFEDDARAPMRFAADRPLASGFQRTGDGRWMFLHAGFPHNTESLLELFGHPRDADAMRRVLNGWEAPALEAEIMQRGLCSAMVRTPDEFDASEPARVLAERPVVEILKIGEAPPRARQRGADRPLSDHRVLDLTRVLAGPTCARTLASYGAEVLRVGSKDLPFVAPFIADTGLGKRNTFIELKTETGAAELDALLPDADVFSQGYRGGAMERLGFGPEQVAEKSPGIVYVSINCYGHEGPWRTIPGWEQLAQTVSGVAHLHGEHVNDGVPLLQPAAVTDYTTGFLAAFGALVALHRQRTEGGSYWVRVSLTRSALWLRSLGLSSDADADAIKGEERRTMQKACVTSSWGVMRHLAASVGLSSTDVGWRRPPSELGTAPGSWG